MKKDIKVILGLAKTYGVNLHKTFNKDLFDSLIGNSHTENIAFAEIVLAAVELRNEGTINSIIIDDDWWDMVQYFRPLAQLFAQVNDIAVIEWNGFLEDIVMEFITYKFKSEDLNIE